MRLLPQFERYPRFVRQAAVGMVGWRNHRLRYGPEYLEWSRFLNSSSSYTSEEIESWQLDQLKRLYVSSAAGSEYYSGYSVDIGEFEKATTLRDALDMLPVLAKADLRDRDNRIPNQRVRLSHRTSTSGSTGAPMSIEHDNGSLQRRFAFFHDHARMAGVDPFAPSVRFSGRILCKVGTEISKPWLVNTSERQAFLSSYHLDKTHQKQIVRFFDRWKPVLIDGYPSAILECLKLIESGGGRLDSLKAVITTAETLDPAVRDSIERMSGVQVMDYYSASEGIPFIQQCRFGTYHVRWQSGVIEVGGANGIGFAGDGELICTSFVQARTPLIRYRTGDLVQGFNPTLGRCQCGMKTPTVDALLGRVEDSIRTPDGRTIGMFTYRTLKTIKGIVESQVIQHGYSDFEVRGVLTGEMDVTAVKQQIQESFERALGYPIGLNFLPVSQLTKGANGKIRLVVSKVHDVR